MDWVSVLESLPKVGTAVLVSSDDGELLARLTQIGNMFGFTTDSRVIVRGVTRWRIPVTGIVLSGWDHV